MIRTAIFGKPSLHPNDIDCVTVRDIVRFIRKSHRLDYNKYLIALGDG